MAEWSNDQVLLFLEYYQMEPVIWDPLHACHKDKSKVGDAWKRLSEKLNFTVKELKIKKETLMGTFRRHFKKKQDSTRSGAGADEIYQPIWAPYQLMESFLLPVYTTRRTIDTETDTEREPPTTQTTFEEDTNEIEETASSPAITSEIRSVAAKKNRHQPELNVIDHQMATAFGSLTDAIRQKSQVPEDECDWYAKVLAHKLRQYPSDERTRIMYEIDGIFMNRINYTIRHETPSPLPSPFPTPSPNPYFRPLNIHIPDQPSTTRSSLSEPFPNTSKRHKIHRNSYSEHLPFTDSEPIIKKKPHPIQVQPRHIPSYPYQHQPVTSTNTHSHTQSPSVQYDKSNSIPHQPLRSTNTHSHIRSPSDQYDTSNSIPHQPLRSTNTHSHIQSPSDQYDTSNSIPHQPLRSTNTHSHIQSPSDQYDTSNSIPHQPLRSTNTHSHIQSPSDQYDTSNSIPHQPLRSTNTHSHIQSPSDQYDTSNSIPHQPLRSTNTHSHIQSPSDQYDTSNSIPHQPLRSTNTHSHIQSPSDQYDTSNSIPHQPLRSTNTHSHIQSPSDQYDTSNSIPHQPLRSTNTHSHIQSPSDQYDTSNSIPHQPLRSTNTHSHIQSPSDQYDTYSIQHQPVTSTITHSTQPPSVQSDTYSTEPTPVPSVNTYAIHLSPDQSMGIYTSRAQSSLGQSSNTYAQFNFETPCIHIPESETISGSNIIRLALLNALETLRPDEHNNYEM